MSIPVSRVSFSVTRAGAFITFTAEGAQITQRLPNGIDHAEEDLTYAYQAEEQAASAALRRARRLRAAVDYIHQVKLARNPSKVCE